MTELDILNAKYSISAGSGPAKRIALLLLKNGIGDDIHCMPALSQKVKDGFEVVVYAREFSRKCFESVGCEFRSAGTLSAGSIEELAEEFGEIYSLSHWCRIHEIEQSGTPVLSRFAQFARLIQTTLPADFNWAEVFGVSVEPRDTVTLALYSENQYRSFTRAESLRLALREDLGAELYSIGPVVQRSMLKTFDGLLERIATSKLVVSIDTGILAIALALNVPTIALFGPTDERTIAWQYHKYHKDLKLTVMRAEIDNRCVAPCSFAKNKGWDRSGDCSKFSRCMSSFSVDEVELKVNELLGKEAVCSM